MNAKGTHNDTPIGFGIGATWDRQAAAFRGAILMGENSDTVVIWKSSELFDHADAAMEDAREHLNGRMSALMGGL